MSTNLFWTKEPRLNLTCVGSQLSLKTHQIWREKRVLPALWPSPPGQDITWLQKIPRFRKFGIPKNTWMFVPHHWHLILLLCSLLCLGLQGQHLELLELGPSDFSRKSWLPQNQYRSSHMGSGFPGWTLPDTFHCSRTNKQMDAIICTLALVS